MSDSAELRRREGAAKARLDQAIGGAYEELRAAGVGGMELLDQVNARVEAERGEYEELKYERIVEERDGRMLWRGTLRGFWFAAALLFAFLTWQAILDARNLDAQRDATREHYATDPPADVLPTYEPALSPGVEIGVCAFVTALLLLMVWNYSRIPLLGKELPGGQS